MDEQNWQVLRRKDGELFLINGTPGHVIAAWGPLTPVADSTMFDRAEDFTTVEELPQLATAGRGTG